MRPKAFFIPLFVFAAVFLIATSAAFAAAESQKERYIVKMKAGEPADITTQSLGTEKIGDLKIIGAVVVSANTKELESIKNLPGVEYVEKDIKVYALDMVPWGVARTGAPSAWASNKTGAGVKVAILDTGIDYSHRDLSGVYAGGTTFVSGTSAPMDDNGHGSHVSGSVAAAYNGVGIVGVAPGVRLYSVKVLNSAGSGYVSDIIRGIDWSINNSMQVVSMSFGTSSYIASLDEAIQRAYASGIVLVAAAGNSGTGSDTVGYPAKFSQVIAVAATDESNNRASFSSTGPAVSLAAPGVSINSTVPGNSYARYSGTSMAAPHVSGVAALLLATAIPSGYDLNSNGKWDPAEVRNRMQTTATDLGAAGKDSYYGYGLINASAAVAASAPISLPSFDYSLSLSPASGAVVRGSGANTTITAALISGATEAVSLSCAGLPSGASCSFYPAALLPTASSALVILTSNSTPAGTHSITVNSASLNGTSRSAAYSLTVSLPPPILANYSATFFQSGMSPGTIWGVTVAGTRYNTSGTSITVSGLSGAANYSYDAVVSGTVGTRYPCNSGCFGQINSSANVSAAYRTQYQLAMASSPASGGTTTPAAGTYWHDSGTPVTISASSALGYAFSSWSGTGNGSYSGTTNPESIIMNAPVFETANFQITEAIAPYFSDDFESSGSGWSAAGLWHKTTRRSSSPVNSFWYGNETSGNYRTKNTRNFGYLTSQPISLAGAVAPQLAFMSWYRTESGTAYDKKIVQVSGNGGINWSGVKQISDARSVWNSELINLTAYVNKTIIIRFYFDTVDGYSNSYEGWYVDDVRVEEAGASSAATSAPEQGHRGQPVAGMKDK